YPEVWRESKRRTGRKPVEKKKGRRGPSQPPRPFLLNGERATPNHIGSRLTPANKTNSCPARSCNHPCSQTDDGLIICQRRHGPTPGLVYLGLPYAGEWGLYRGEGAQRERPAEQRPVAETPTVIPPAAGPPVEADTDCPRDALGGLVDADAAARYWAKQRRRI